MSTTINPEYYETALNQYNLSAQKPADDFSVHEITNVELTILRGKTTNNQFVKKLNALSIEIPQPMSFTGTLHSGNLTIGVSPDEFWVISPTNTKHHFYQQAIDLISITPKVGAVVKATGGYSYLQLKGKRLQEILSQLIAYDLRNLTPGKAISTSIHQTSILLVNLDSSNLTSLLAMVRFSYADHIYRLLKHTSNTV